MQPRTLVLILTVLPLLANNGVYLLSALEGNIPWCIPYLDGCTTISRAARSGSSLYVFRPVMIAYAVLLALFWLYAKHWLDSLYGRTTAIARMILWLGLVGTLTLLVYIDFLGTTGEINRFMRRVGVMFFFTLTPLAQLLLLNQHYRFAGRHPAITAHRAALRYQLVVLLLMLVIGLASIVLAVTGAKTYETENIVEWNFSLLMTLYFAGCIAIWKEFRLSFSIGRK